MLLDPDGAFIELFDELKAVILEDKTGEILELQGRARALSAAGRLDPMLAGVLTHLNRATLKAEEKVAASFRY